MIEEIKLVENRREARSISRGLDRLVADHEGDWPEPLLNLGHRAALAIRSLDQPNVPPVMVREAAKDLAAFTEAHAAHIAGA